MVGEGCGLEVQSPIGVLAGEPPVGGVVGAVEFAVVSGGGLEGGIPRGGVISGPAGEFPLKGFSGAIGLSGPGCLIEVDDFIDDIPGDGVAGEFSGLGFFEGDALSAVAEVAGEGAHNGDVTEIEAVGGEEGVELGGVGGVGGVKGDEGKVCAGREGGVEREGEFTTAGDSPGADVIPEVDG